MEAVLERFKLDPIGDYEYEMLESGSNDVWEYIKEAQTGTTKKNFFQKILALIAKIARWIVTKIQQLVKFIKGLFTRKEKPISQILGENFKAFSFDVFSYDKFTLSPSSSSSSTGSSVIKSMNLESNGMVSASVEIKSIGSNGDINAREEILQIANDIKFRMSDDGKIVIETEIHKNGAGVRYNANPRNDDSKASFVKRQPSANVTGTAIGIYLMWKICTSDELYGALERIASSFKEISAMGKDSSKEATQFIADIDLITSISKNDFNGQTSFDMNDLTKISDIMKKVVDAMNSDAIVSNNYPPQLAEPLNRLSSFLVKLQFGVNVITGCIIHRYDPDPRYIGMVKDTKVLDECVHTLIASHIPSKFVARTAYLLADEKLRAYSDIDEPAFGQSRLGLFPEDTSKVIKVALNALGIHDIAKDANTYSLVSKAGGADLLAKILSVESNKCVETAERTMSADQSQLRDSFRDDYRALVNKIESLEANGVSISDIGKHNVGYLGNKLVLFDYGQASATSTTAPST